MEEVVKTVMPPDDLIEEITTPKTDIDAEFNFIDENLHLNGQVDF